MGTLTNAAVNWCMCSRYYMLMDTATGQGEVNTLPEIIKNYGVCPLPRCSLFMQSNTRHRLTANPACLINALECSMHLDSTMYAHACCSCRAKRSKTKFSD